MIDQRYAIGGLMFLVLTLTFRDLAYNGRSYAQEEDSENADASSSWTEETSSKLSSSGKKIPHTNLNHIITGPTLKFQYCYSCGYRKAFEEYSTILKEKYPDLAIVGENYPPPPAKAILVQVVGLLKFAIIFMIISNINPFTLLGRETPAAWNWLASSKIYGCLMTFFICNTIEGQLISSGAFEIFYNDVPIWSKLETGRVPAPAELFQIIDNQMLSKGTFQY